jgi:alpha-mannosidase
VLLDGPAVILAAFKKAEDGNDIVVRLYEPTGQPRTVGLRLPAFGARKKVRMGPFEVKTLRFIPRSRQWAETDLMERRLTGK